MRVTGFFHAGVTVSDMDRSLRFYRDALGLEPMSDGYASEAARHVWNIDSGRVRVVFLRIPGSGAMIELFDFEEIERHSASARPSDFGAGHMCLFVDDAEAMLRRAGEYGFRARADSVVSIEDGPRTGAKVAYLIDPDGYHVEIFERPRVEGERAG